VVEHIGSSWNRLKTLKLKEVTQSNISDSVKESFISEKKYLENIISLHQAKVAQSTFGSGGTIPSTGSIESSVFGDTITAIQPATGEVWVMDPALLQVTNGGGAPANITPSLTDGTTTMNFPAVTIQPGLSGFVLGVDSAAAIQSYGMRLSNTLYFQLISSVDQPHTYFMPITKEAF